MENKKILLVLKSNELKEKIISLSKNIKIESSFKTKENLTKEDFQEKDLIISIGGDGTFLSASHFISNQKILGVNSDLEKSEGALTSISLNQLPGLINNFLSNKTKTEEHTRIKVKIIKKDCCIQTEVALNEVYFGNINPHHPSNYLLEFNQNKENQRSSGVIISTGTGSTAWYNAMGGIPFSKQEKLLKFKIREPYNGRIHKITIQEGEIKDNTIFSLTSLMNHGLVAIDSIRTYPLLEGDKVEISIGIPLNVIQ